MNDSIVHLVALHIVYIVLCLGIVAAVICRVDEMNRKRNKLSWWLMYMLFAAFALAVLIDGVATREWNKAYLLGLAALGANLLITMKNWRGGPPPMSCRPPRCEAGSRGGA